MPFVFDGARFATGSAAAREGAGLNGYVPLCAAAITPANVGFTHSSVKVVELPIISPRPSPPHKLRRKRYRCHQGARNTYYVTSAVTTNKLRRNRYRCHQGARNTYYVTSAVTTNKLCRNRYRCHQGARNTQYISAAVTPHKLRPDLYPTHTQQHYEQRCRQTSTMKTSFMHWPHIYFKKTTYCFHINTFCFKQ